MEPSSLTAQFKVLNLSMAIWFWILGWVLSILTITGNGFIIFLVSSDRQLRTKTNALIVSLALADFLVGATVVPFLFLCMIILKNGCIWPREWPSWVYLMRWLFSYASMMNLCSLVLDRYIAVVKPLKYGTLMTCRRVIRVIFFSWAIPVGFVTTSLFFAFYATLDSIIIFICICTMFFEIASLCMLVFFFASMVHVVYKHDRLAASYAKQLSFNHRVLTFNSRDKSAVTMTSIVVGIFVICYGIYLRCGFIYIFTQKSCNDFQYKTLVLVLNSGINPLAYAFFKRDLKKKIKRLLCRRERK